MNLFQALLLALWAGYCSYDDQGPQMLRRPLLIGPIDVYKRQSWCIRSNNEGDVDYGW